MKYLVYLLVFRLISKKIFVINMPNNKNLKETLKHLRVVRALWVKHFPFSRSSISSDILVAVMSAKLSGEKLYVKCLFNDLNHSVMGQRYHFDKLVKDGWILLVNGTDDRRLKVCLPSQQLEEKFIQIAKELLELRNQD